MASLNGTAKLKKNKQKTKNPQKNANYVDNRAVTVPKFYGSGRSRFFEIGFRYYGSGQNIYF
jgi:hypothetical protein